MDQPARLGVVSDTAGIGACGILAPAADVVAAGVAAGVGEQFEHVARVRRVAPAPGP